MLMKTVYKWWFVWDFEKEERWLNEMAADGWKLCGVGFSKYEFEKSEPGEYSIRIQFDQANVADPDVELVGKCTRWYYYAKHVDNGPFELMNDIDSKISHLSRIIQMLKLICLANLIIGLANSFNDSSLGWVNLVCAIFLAYAWGRIEGKKESLEKDRVLFE